MHSNTMHSIQSIGRALHKQHTGYWFKPLDKGICQMHEYKLMLNVKKNSSIYIYNIVVNKCKLTCKHTCSYYIHARLYQSNDVQFGKNNDHTKAQIKSLQFSHCCITLYSPALLLLSHSLCSSVTLSLFSLFPSDGSGGDGVCVMPGPVDPMLSTCQAAFCFLSVVFAGMHSRHKKSMALEN